jgi:hypothetical protein
VTFIEDDMLLSYDQLKRPIRLRRKPSTDIGPRTRFNRSETYNNILAGLYSGLRVAGGWKQQTDSFQEWLHAYACEAVIDGWL